MAREHTHVLTAVSNRPMAKVLFLLGIIIFGFWIISFFPGLVLTLLFSILSAFILRPFVTVLEFRFGLNRIFSVSIVFLLVGGTLIVLSIFFIPIVIERLKTLYDGFKNFPFDQKLDEAVINLTANIPFMDPETVTQKVHTAVLSGLQGVSGFLASTAGFLVNLFIVPFITFFILSDGDTALKRLIERVPNKYFEMMLNVLNKIQKDLVGYLRGWILDSVIVGILNIAGFYLIGVNYAILLGIFATLKLPREEEPQIVVPMVDIYVPLPGASPQEVESQVTTPLEKRLWGIPGVEYLYSTSLPGVALITVRFKVNEPQEPSLVKVHQELSANADLLPAGAMKPIVRLLTIDDVPFLSLTLHGRNATPGQLREDIDRLVYIQDEPFGSLSMYAQFCVMRLASTKVKVVLDGQGADELLGGYLGYQGSYIRHLISTFHWGTALSEGIGSMRHHRGFFADAMQQLKVRKERRTLLKCTPETIDRYQGTLDEVLHRELLSTNLPALLHYEDRNSMASSV